jgi:lysophospholipase L1-like esterase
MAVTSGSGITEQRSQRAKGSSLPPGARVALVLFGILAPLLLVEIGLRIAGPLLPGEYQTASFVETHPSFGRRNKPGEGWKKTSEYTSWLEISSKGLRGPETEFDKPVGESRVLVLGDSFTFAEQVNLPETFVQRLEDQLNSSGQKQYRVLNGGSNGWATANELIYLAKEGIRYQPDIVVLAFYVGNDISDNFRRVAAARDAEEADLALRGVDALDGFRKVVRASETYTLFESGVLSKISQLYPGSDADSSEAAIRAAPKTADDAVEAWAITEGLIRRMDQVAKSQGAGFVVMVIPSADQVAGNVRNRGEEDDPDDADTVSAPGLDKPQERLSEITGRLGVPTLDLLPDLRRQATRSRNRLFYRQNAHFTAAGHTVTAQALYDFLVAKGM